MGVSVPTVPVSAVRVAVTAVAVLAVGVAMVRVTVVMGRAAFAAVGVSVTESADAHQVDQQTSDRHRLRDTKVDLRTSVLWGSSVSRKSASRRKFVF